MAVRDACARVAVFLDCSDNRCPRSAQCRCTHASNSKWTQHLFRNQHSAFSVKLLAKASRYDTRVCANLRKSQVSGLRERFIIIRE